MRAGPICAFGRVAVLAAPWAIPKNAEAVVAVAVVAAEAVSGTADRAAGPGVVALGEGLYNVAASHRRGSAAGVVQQPAVVVAGIVRGAAGFPVLVEPFALVRAAAVAFGSVVDAAEASGEAAHSCAVPRQESATLP